MIGEVVSRYVRYVSTICLLAMATVACQQSAQQSTPPASATATAIVTSVSQVAATAVLATATPSLPAPSPTLQSQECTFDAAFVSDVTVPDNTEVTAGSTLLKTWRLRNSGTCTWEPGTIWVYSGGRRMDGPDSVEVPITAPGETVNVSVTLVAPDTEGAQLGIWQMHSPDGEAFGELGVVRVRVVTGDSTPTPPLDQPSTPVSTPTIDAVSGPAIHFFTANVELADPGDTISLAWDTSGASTISIYHLLGSGQLGMPFWEVDPSGTLDYSIDVNEHNATRFVLYASDGNNTAQATVNVVLNCLDVWFFSQAPDICPAAPPLHSPAAQQSFEHGMMIWIQAQDRIIALYDDGQYPRWRSFVDGWNEGDLEDDPDIRPPAGFYQPRRGFGLAWREQSGARDRLGWATSTESGFETVVQATSRFKYNDTFIQALNGSILQLETEGSGWQTLSP